VAISALSERRLAAPETLAVSVVIPCLNEAESIAQCVAIARRVLEENGLDAEVVVVDNGSDDGSGALARMAGARVIDEPRRGYGSANLAGFAAARGDYIVMIDADLTYDFEEIPGFIRELDNGAELVMGNRMDAVEPGAMPLLSRIGNPLMSRFLNLLFKTPIRDTWCGLRAFRRDVLPALGLQATGMELASEMVIRAARVGLEIRELPIALHPREGKSKLNPFKDGLRSLRLMLVYHPNFLFVFPGAFVGALGALLMALVFAHVSLFGHLLLIHALIGGSLLVVVGTQLVGFGLCGRSYAVYQLGDRDPLFERMGERVRLEQGLLLGLAFTVAGLGLGAVVVGHWVASGLGSLAEERVTVLAATLLIVGVQIIFTSFLLSLLGLRRRRGAAA
jgi:glycosyltransferase involved in cell wall biosynthesis